ncbi:hypothetical protein [Desulfarculus baarsii]
MRAILQILAGLASLATSLLTWARERRLAKAGRDEALAQAATEEADAREAQQKAAAQVVAETFGDDGGAGLANRVRRDGF